MAQCGTPFQKELFVVNEEKSPAVVLLSGGLDSATALAEAKAAGFALYALTVAYGQRHAIEIEAARRVAQSMGVVRHVEQVIDLRAFGGSALTSDLDVPKNRAAEEMTTGIPITYVPARNTVFLALALAWAETVGAFDIFVGVNCVDYSGYPDCRPEYLEAFEAMANLATRRISARKKSSSLTRLMNGSTGEPDFCGVSGTQSSPEDLTGQECKQIRRPGMPKPRWLEAEGNPGASS